MSVFHLHPHLQDSVLQVISVIFWAGSFIKIDSWPPEPTLGLLLAEPEARNLKLCSSVMHNRSLRARSHHTKNDPFRVRQHLFGKASNNQQLLVNERFPPNHSNVKPWWLSSSQC